VGFNRLDIVNVRSQNDLYGNTFTFFGNLCTTPNL